ncbi:macrophage mannose receptor 1-like isoform X2 [Mya arenaria]|uniref:macrophage mannose receptor 1-like isoform X2 n=1 Tax=Mya arenaria TaxID=6604 RepID=UPI0022E3F90D|nr:macrophage mannose receptor 1-like isoform X2 [Mya arenaria]
MRINLNMFTLTAVCIILCITKAQGQGPSCPWGWQTKQGDPTWPCYLVTNKIQRTFLEAQKFCHAMGGSLLKIDSLQEKTWIFGLVSNYQRYYPTHHEWWIGMEDNVAQTAQIWLDQSPVTQTFLQWVPGEPQHYDPANKCVETLNGNLKHRSCDTNQYFICERARTSVLWCDATRAWEVMGNKCYLIVRKSLTWEDARANCQANNADLMVIEDDETEQHLWDFIEARRADMWIGLRAKPAPFGYAFKWVGISNKDLDVLHAYWLGMQTTNNALQTVVDSNGTNACVIANHSTGVAGVRNNWQMMNCGVPAFSICQKEQGRCAAGWIRNGQKCYQINNRIKLSYSSAVNYCQQQNAILLTIKTNATQQFINSQISGFGALRVSAIWLGLSDASMAQWTWSDGSGFQTPPYQDFDNLGGQPMTDHTGLDCFVIFTNDRNGTWIQSTGCNSENNSFICEIGLGIAPTYPTSPPGASTQQPGVVTTGAASWSSECGPFYVLDSITGYCYRFSDQSLNFFMARSTCVNDSADLASITSFHEQNFLANRMFAFRSVALWIGAANLAPNKGYHWLDGSGFGYINWSPGEPNNFNGHEHCTEFVAGGDNIGRWNDVTCTSQRGYICKKKSSMITTTAPSTTPTIPSGKIYGCPSADWYPEQNVCWFIKVANVTWAQARATCQNMTSDLASIRNEQEQNFMYSLLPLVTSVNDQFWIGLTDAGNQMQFRWTDGSQVGYTNWASSEPNNWGNRAEDCVSMHVWPSISRNGEWNDAICEDPAQGFVCRLDKALVPSGTPQMVRNNGCTAFPGSFTYGPKCFKVFSDAPDTWDVGTLKCQENGGQLATIANAYQQAIVASQLKGGGAYWIGLSTASATNNTMVWVNGYGLAFSAWAYGHTGNEVNKCVTMRSGSPGQGRWMAQDCLTNQKYVCEYPRAGWPRPSITPPPVTQRTSCPTGWNEYSGNCYRFYNQKLNWFQAHDSCQSMGADLISIHSPAEQTAAFSGHYGTTIWIGLNDLDTEMGYSWSDGSPLSYRSWGNGEPNDAAGTDDCVEYASWSHRWNDNTCYAARPYVCKIRKGLPILTTTPPAVPVTKFPSCPFGPLWHRNGTMCYYVSQRTDGEGGRATWYGARDICAKQGGRLASIHGIDGNNFILSLLTANSTDDAWIGLVDNGVNQFIWSDGTPLDFIHWNGGEPNDYLGMEKCGQMFQFSGYWNDNDCNSKSHFICQRPANSQVASVTVPTTPLISGGCPVGFIPVNYDNKCYNIYGGDIPTARQNYTSAYAACRALGPGYDIASITSHKELATLVSIFVSAVQDQSGIWIGLNARNHERRYTWQDSARLNFTNWAKGEPNWSGDTCVEIYTDSRKAGRWNDIACSRANAYICETTRSTAIATPAPSSCMTLNSPGNIENPNTFDCYRLQTTPMTWNDAVTACQSHQMTLATVTGVYDQAFIDTLIAGYNTPVWIGLGDPGLTGTYMWQDHFPVLWTSWAKGEPTYTTGEGCVTTNSGLWNDTFCVNKYPSVCKKSFFPPGTSTLNPGGYCANITWQQFGNKCYFLDLQSAFTWANAEQQCKGRGMELASVMSMNEEKFILQLVDNHELTNADVWLGFRRADNYFSWTDSSPTSYIHWRSAPTRTSGSDCVYMHDGDGTWDNTDCTTKKGFICKTAKLPATSPQPTTTPIKTLSTQPPPKLSSSAQPSKALTSSAPISTTQVRKQSSRSQSPVTSFTPGNGIKTPPPSSKTGAHIPSASELQNQQLPNLPPDMSSGSVAGIIVGILVLLTVICLVLIILKRQSGGQMFQFAKFANGDSGFDNATYDRSIDSVQINGSMTY